MEGQVIAGRYRLVRVLGKGGMGAVWLAEQLALHTPIAVKLIDFEAAKNANARARFEREAQVVARIRSAHVVKVFDHGVTDQGLPFIAMECLVGESLRDRIAARTRLSLAETAKVITHVCRALSKAHEAGLVHRDLKPENIFVAKEDDGEIVKILDFGVAKATDILASTGMDPTRTGALLGTPYYMSPEQAQGLKTVDFRSDLWAVGVLAFECLTGKRPFTAPALGPLIAKIMSGQVPALAQAAPDAGIPADVEGWLRKALSRDPSARFASAREMSDSFVLAAGMMDTMDRGGAAPSPAHAMSPGAPAPSAAPWAAPPAPTEAGSDENAATILLDASQAAQLSGAPPTPFTGPAAPAPAGLAPSHWQSAPPQQPLSTTPQPVFAPAVPAPAARSNLGVVLAVAIGLLVLGGAAAALLLR